MQIKYIANIRMPTEKAHGLQIMKMCEALSRQEAEVELVVPWRFNPIKDDPFQYYGVEKIFKITKIFSLDLVRFGKLGFLLQSLSFAKMTLFYLLFKNIDIIYSRDELPLFYSSFFKKNLFWEAHNGIFNFVVKKVLKKCKGIISISKGLRDFYVAKGVAPEKILIAPDGVELDNFQFSIPKYQIREELNLPQDKKIILYTGHLYEWKGAPVLAGASEYLDNDCLTVFVGGTEKDIKIFNFQFSNLKNILVVGYRPHKEIPLWLKAADVLILPNSAKEKISKFYTSPLKLFEYMASGLPIIASDLPSVREILKESEAILVKPDNPQSLAGGIKKVISDSTLAKKISKNALQKAQNYSWEKRAKNILKFIGEKKMKGHFDYLLEHIPSLSKLSVLDIGSGRGAFLLDVAGHGDNATGLEINNAYIKETLDKADKNNLSVKVVQGMAEKLPFPDAVFDFVNFALVIEHIENPNLAVKEMARVMKIGGQAYVGVPNRFGFKDPHFNLWFVNWLPRSWCNGFITLFGKHKDYNGPAGRQNLKDMHYYTFGQIKKILNKAGFEVIDIREKKIRNFFKNNLVCLPFIFLYKVKRFFFDDSFHLLLKKVEDTIVDMQEGKLLSSIVYPEFFEIDKEDRVLNLGCGIGPQAIIYKDQYREMVGIDINKKSLEKAEQIMNVLGIKNFQTFHSNVEDIDLPDKSFDKAIAIDIMEHVINPDKFLQETRRLLRDNGSLLITFPAMHDKFVDVISFIGRKIFKKKSKKESIAGWNPDEHQYDYSVKEWLEIIERNGFKIEKSRATTMFPPLHYCGISRFWFKNKMIHKIDAFFCRLPLLKYCGQALICICRKK